MKKLIVGMLMLLGVGMMPGCANVIDRYHKQSDLPPVGNLQTAALGARLLNQQDVDITYGRDVNPTTKVSSWGESFSLFGMYDRMNNGKKYCGIVFDSEYPDIERLICLTDKQFKDKKIPYVDSEVIVPSPTNSQHILEYAGKSANTISLFYKEFNNSFIRPASTKEFKFDLSESKIIDIKGARIEVIEANNTGITYKVINHFPR